MCNIYISVHSEMFNQNTFFEDSHVVPFQLWSKFLSDFILHICPYFPLGYSEMTTEYIREAAPGNLIIVGRSVVSFDLLALFGFLHFFPVRS